MGNWGYYVTQLGLFFITLLAGIVLAVLAIVPPAPQSPDIAVDKFSSGRAMAFINAGGWA